MQAIAARREYGGLLRVQLSAALSVSHGFKSVFAYRYESDEVGECEASSDPVSSGQMLRELG